METHSNRLVVSVVSGLLMTIVIGFAMWLIQAHDPEGPTYEIRFEQSVAGLQNGSGVSFLGVPVGRVTEVSLQPEDPGLVIVRFVLTEDITLRRGVTASIDRALFDGSATISLRGGGNRDAVLVALPGQPFPVIPSKGSGLAGGDLSPTDFIAKVSSAVERVSEKLDPVGQRAIEEHLGAQARRSPTWANDVDRIASQIAPNRIESFGNAIARAGSDAERLRDRLEGSRGRFRKTFARSLHDSERTAESLGRSFSAARPRIMQLKDNARQVTNTVRSVRERVRGVSDTAEKIDRTAWDRAKCLTTIPPTESWYRRGAGVGGETGRYSLPRR